MRMPRSRFRRIVLATGLLLAAGLLALHFFYPLGFVYDVWVYQYPEFSDIHRQPARRIAAAARPVRFHACSLLPPQCWREILGQAQWPACR